VTGHARAWRRWPGWILLFAWAAAVMVPLYILIVSCFKSTGAIYANSLGLPSSWTFDNFVQAWERGRFSLYLLNSLLVTGSAVVLTILAAAMAAYPLSRYRLWWGLPLLGFFLAGIMIPVRLGSVELFNLMKSLSLLDSRPGLVLVYAAIRIPFAVFIFANFMRAVPQDLEHAARIDGAREWRILFQIILPQIRPAVGVVAIFTAIAVWNDFFFPLIFIFDDDLKTVPLGVTTFIGQYRTDWGLLFAALTISMAPFLLLYPFVARRLREGVGAGGGIR